MAKRRRSTKYGSRKRQKRARGARMVRYRKAISSSSNVRMRYLARLTLNPTNDIGAVHLLRPDSIFDPDSTGGGHQPWGHDQLTPLYTKYRVVACKMKFKFIPFSTNVVPLAVGATIRRDGSTEADITDYVEGGPYTKWRYIGAENTNGAYFSMTYRPRILHGKSFGDDDFASVGASPTSTAAYCHVWVARPGAATTDSTGCSCDVVMDFWVQLTESKNVGQS